MLLLLLFAEKHAVSYGSWAVIIKFDRSSVHSTSEGSLGLVGSATIAPRMRPAHSNLGPKIQKTVEDWCPWFAN
jgi:hypothetical protein